MIITDYTVYSECVYLIGIVYDPALLSMSIRLSSLKKETEVLSVQAETAAAALCSARSSSSTGF